MYLRRRHLSGKSSYLSLSELMISASVSLSVSCTVHVSGTGPDVYPLSTLQSISSHAVGRILASNRRKTTQYARELSNPVQYLEKRFLLRAEVHNIVAIMNTVLISIRNEYLRIAYEPVTMNWHANFWLLVYNIATSQTLIIIALYEERGLKPAGGTDSKRSAAPVYKANWDLRWHIVKDRAIPRYLLHALMPNARLTL